MKNKNITITLVSILLVEICFGYFKQLGTDLYNIMYDGRIGFGYTYEYTTKGLEFPYRDDINLSNLNLYGLQTYFADYSNYEKISYYITAMPTSRLSLKWSYDYTKPYKIWNTQNSLIENYSENTYTLDTEYFIFPRWSLYGMFMNQKKERSLNKLIFEKSTISEYENVLYKLTNETADIVKIGTKFRPEWGELNIYNITSDIYSYSPELSAIPKDTYMLSYENLYDNVQKKENDFNIYYFINPAVKLDISGLYQNRVTYTNRQDDLIEFKQYIQYPFEVKYRVTEVWELGVKVNNESVQLKYDTKNKELVNEIEVWRVKKDNITKKNDYISLSLGRYFKYQGLNIYGKLFRLSYDSLYEFTDEILYGEEKISLWSRWDESVRGYQTVFGFYYRPIMEKLYVSAEISYLHPTTYRYSSLSNFTKSEFNYVFSAFYKPTTLFEIKIEKGIKDIVQDFRVDPSYLDISKEISKWLVERNSMSNYQETESIAVTLRTAALVLTGAIKQTSISNIYYRRDDILSLDRYKQPWAFVNLNQKFLFYLLSFGYTIQSTFSGSQLTLNGGLSFTPTYSYDKGDGTTVDEGDVGYSFSVRYEFTPTFYLEGTVEEAHYYQKSENVGLKQTGSVLAIDGLHSYRQTYKINFVYRP